MAAGGLENDFATLITELAAFRKARLKGQPSDRTLAKAARVSPTTIGDWLRGTRFPQQIELLLRAIRAMRVQAERTGLFSDPAVASLFDEQRWRDAYLAEARRRADATRTHVQADQARSMLEGMRPGRPLAQVTDPFQLEVHRAIDVDDATSLPQLPLYVPREHDRLLGRVVERAASGTSSIAVLVGGSSTGKTRACWEALNALRDRDEPWRLWHPIDPTRADAALADLRRVGPYTVVWLNEAQFYLGDEALGERVAAGLRELLRDAQRGPVLVLATLWPNHWDTLTTRTDPDNHAQARELLDGHDIRVPDAFTSTDLKTLTDQVGEDARLREAAQNATEGQITQYLAGVPLLMNRYTHALPATKALIHAAMDARRLGAGPHLPLALLAAAAPGYLTDTEWEQTGQDWLERALDYVTQPCNGIPGILVPVKAGALRNRRSRRANTAAGLNPPSVSGQGPLYRLADYLEQHGRRTRARKIPPVDFWTAVASHASLSEQATFGRAAWDRGLYRDAAQLLKNAATQGDPSVGRLLVNHMHVVHPDDYRPAHWAVAHARFNDPSSVGSLLHTLREVGADEQFAAMLARNPAAQVDLGDLVAVGLLLETLREVGADEQVAVLAERVATQVDLGESLYVAWLLEMLRRVGADEQVAVLAERVATQVDLVSPDVAAWMLDSLRRVGAEEQLAALVERLPAAGRFDVSLELDAQRERFKFGREPDGNAAEPWSWDDLY